MSHLIGWAFVTIVALIATWATLIAAPQYESPIDYVTTPEIEARIIQLDERALDAAYIAHVQLLFASWMKDSTGQPERVQRGVQKARKAYIGSLNAIEVRKKGSR